MTRIESPPRLPSPPETMAYRPRRRRPAGLILLVLGATLAFAVYFVPLPYFVLGPGPAQDVVPLIHLRGTASFPAGHLLLTSITEDRTNLYGLIGAWVSPAETVVPERDLLLPGQTEQQEFDVARSQMDTSKIDAAVVAFSLYRGYPSRHRPGALVEQTFAGTPADGRLFPGDLIVAADGRPIDGPVDLHRDIVRTGPGHSLRLTVRGRPTGTADVTVNPTRIRIRGQAETIIGVSLVRNFPFPLSIESDDIGGPSAGLMWTLGLIDLLTPGDLTGGRLIAGTGQIDQFGTVYPIGGIEQKVVAAERAGASVFFAPAADAADARSVANKIHIVSVRSYRDALNFLVGAVRRS